MPSGAKPSLIMVGILVQVKYFCVKIILGKMEGEINGRLGYRVNNLALRHSCYSEMEFDLQEVQVGIFTSKTETGNCIKAVKKPSQYSQKLMTWKPCSNKRLTVRWWTPNFYMIFFPNKILISFEYSFLSRQQFYQGVLSCLINILESQAETKLQILA